MSYSAGPICIDELVTVMGQYRTDTTWNGFLIPQLDAWSVEVVMAAFQDDPFTESIPTHEWDGDVLVLTEWDGDDPYPERLEPDEDGLYALGAYGWVWSEDREPFTLDHEGHRWTVNHYLDPRGDVYMAVDLDDEDGAWTFPESTEPPTQADLEDAVHNYHF